MQIELPANKVKENGFAKFNGGQHLCVELPDDWFTISCKNSKGNKITFAFCPSTDGKGHQCVDIVNHSGKLTPATNPIQQASFRGEGPLNARCTYDDKVPTTLVSVSLTTPR